MSNHIRKAIFWTLFIAFLAAGAPLVLFSIGYQLHFNAFAPLDSEGPILRQLIDRGWEDLSGFAVTKSGGLYVRSVPANAEIRINGHLIPNDSGILNSGTFVNGLLPGKYELEVSKAGYHSFKTTAEIIPLQVNSFDNLVLVPRAYNTYLAETTLANFYAEDGIVIIQNAAGKLRYNGQTIAGEKFEFFTADRKSVITSVSIEGERVYFLISLSNPRAFTNINEIFWNLKSVKLDLKGEIPIVALAPHPHDSDKVILSTEAALYIVDLKSLAITRSGKGVEKIIQDGSSVFLVRNGLLVGFNVTLRTSFPIIGVKDSSILSVSPSGRRVAILWNDKTLEIYNIDSKKSLRFDLSGRQNIKDIFWHEDSEHVFIRSEDNLYFLYVQKEGINPAVIYENLEQAKYSDNKLFILSNKEIKTSRF